VSVLVLDFKFYASFAYIIYFIFILLLISVLFFGIEVAGSLSWFQIGGFSFQPSEFAKFVTVLALAKFLGEGHRPLDKLKNQVIALAIVAFPLILTTIQGDTGTAMVYGALIIVLYREGISPVYLIVGITFVGILILTLLVSQTVLMIAIVILTLLIVAVSPRNIKRTAVIVVFAIIIVGGHKKVWILS